MAPKMKPTIRWIIVRADGVPAGGETLYRHKVDTTAYLRWVNSKGAFGPYRATRVRIVEIAAPKKRSRK